MLNPIKEIAKWQHDAGNVAKPYDDFLESSFQIEEALEGLDLYKLSDTYGLVPEDECEENITAKQVSRVIASAACPPDRINGVLADVDRLDKACDAIVFAIGSMCKLGLDHHAITKALNIVNDANKAKLGMSRDSEGKLLKPDDFVGPEVKLQALLDSIRR